MQKNSISIFALSLSIAALIYSAYLHVSRSDLNINTLKVNELSSDKVLAGDLSAKKIVIKSGGKELAIITESSVTGGGAIALLDENNNQVFLASDGMVALRGGSPERQKTLINNIRGWPLVFTVTPESSTIAMKGDEFYEVVIESGKTLDDPLAIRGGRISIRDAQGSQKLDGTGIKSAPPRQW